MLPLVVIVGRPNVGKSTLFNRLIGRKEAIVYDQPGVTRDRHYGHGRGASKPYLVVDTGGFEPVVDEGILFEMAKQTLQAVDEADAIIFLIGAFAAHLSVQMFAQGAMRKALQKLMPPDQRMAILPKTGESGLYAVLLCVIAFAGIVETTMHVDGASVPEWFAALRAKIIH